MTTPRIYVRHIRRKDGIRVLVYDDRTVGCIFMEDYPPMNAKNLGKLKMRLKRAFELRYI